MNRRDGENAFFGGNAQLARVDCSVAMDVEGGAKDEKPPAETPTGTPKKVFFAAAPRVGPSHGERLRSNVEVSGRARRGRRGF